MIDADKPTDPASVRACRRPARMAMTAIGASIALMVALGVVGPIGGAGFASAPPWPPWFFHVHPSPEWWSVSLWLAELLGATGLALGLVAVRRGWRPQARRLIAGSAVAVAALMVIPPIDTGDPLMYAAFGRMAAVGRSPYIRTPGQLGSSAGAVEAVVRPAYWYLPSRYGPIATATEAVASDLGGVSAARTILWMKAWNALAYLALVLGLDRVLRSDAARRARAHLLWSLNPLLLLAIMANGHNDVLAAAAGTFALLALRRVKSPTALLAGLLFGLAVGIKAQYALFGAGLAWTARRLTGALAALLCGAAAILVPAYLVAGKAAISATAGLTAVAALGPWAVVAKVLGWQNAIARTNTLGLIASAVLAAILLWRMPTGPRDLPAIRIALALALGLVILSPIQTAWYDAMIFPLLAVMPPSRLDWICIARAAALGAASEPFIISQDPDWLAIVERSSIVGSPTVVLAGVILALLWLCCTRAWKPGGQRDLLIAAIPADASGKRSPTT
jgi:hypothetical protein